MRGLVPTLACALALAGCNSDEPKSAAVSKQSERRALAGAPPVLAAVHRQANQLLGGEEDAFRARVRALRGHPIVVNKWASWCPPCRAEFPFFQKLSRERGKEIAFLGIDSNDNDGNARKFLRDFPVSYPSYRDPRLAVAKEIEAVAAFPSTAFYDRRGKLSYVKQGGYATEAKLAEDIERYAR